MVFELNQTAVSGAGLLRAIAAGGWTSNADLAERAGRRPNHITRDLKVFEGAGLITLTPDIALTDEGRAQLDAIARAEGQTTGGDLLPDERLVVHAQLRPDPDNPRKDFESEDAEEGLDELRQSILLRGRLLQNLVVRADPEGLADYIVTTGNRRWHAIQQAIWDGDWPEDRPIRVVVREGTAQEHLLTAVTENMIRRSMSAIEEAEAFGDLINIHGLKTIDISHETGLSQKVIQNRLKLLRLSDDDKERMRLAEDHPEHLGYKAALRQLTVTKEPEPTLGQLVAEHGTATLSPREPGSPDPSPTPTEAPSLGKKLTDTEALILAEVVDKAEREPNDQHPDYTAALPSAMKSGVPHLIGRGLLGTRQLGMTLLIRPLLHTSGLKDWLEDIGFNRDRDGVLFELAARVVGADRVTQSVRYTTPWLNLEGDPRNEAAPSPPTSDDIALRTFKPDPNLTQAEIDDAYAATERAALRLQEAEQPELIEATEEEKAARRRAERMAAEAASDEAALTTFVGWMRDKLAAKRAEGAHGWRNPEACAAQDIADQLVGHVAKGDPVDIAILAMMLGIKAGAMGAPSHLRTMPTPRMERLMIEARAARQVSADGPAEPDPVEDFVQEELEDEEADAGGVWTEAMRAFDDRRERGGPAVPIRKSIMPDFIVCLEDGRKFKSLKRHLRVKYDLTPDQYIARWGLPRDYPMVAPNYAKARADLARQMGLREA